MILLLPSRNDGKKRASVRSNSQVRSEILDLMKTPPPPEVSGDKLIRPAGEFPSGVPYTT
jgi:hypothetical protein